MVQIDYNKNWLLGGLVSYTTLASSLYSLNCPCGSSITYVHLYMYMYNVYIGSHCFKH